MREIKFKVWDKINKKWLDRVAVSLEDRVWHKDWGEDITDRVCLLQYTGLKDKNGKEIYDGDIVKKTKKYPQKYYCKKEKKLFRICMRVPGDKKVIRWCPGKAGWTTAIRGDWEVIGNIYENPELLANSGGHLHDKGKGKEK